MPVSSASSGSAVHPRTLLARQREQLQNDTSHWDELAPAELQRIANADVFGDVQWHRLPHVDGKKDAPTRYFRAISADLFQVKCVAHGQVVRAFDVHPSSDLPAV